MNSRSTTRWLAGLALTAVVVGGTSAAAVAQSAGQYPPGTPSPTETSVVPSPTKTEVLGAKVTRPPSEKVEVLGAELPRTGVNAAGIGAIGALLLGGGIAVRAVARRRSTDS